MTTKENFDKKNITESMPELWELLSSEEQDFLMDNIKIACPRKNEIIYQANEHPRYLMCLLEGKVKIHMDGVGGRDQIIRLINRKGIFGFRAAFADEKYINAASAFEDSVICMIPINIIKKLIAGNTSLAVYFIKQLSTMLGVADMRTVSLTQKHIRARLAESLLSIKEKYGVAKDESTLNISMSREDLANLSNMTTSNAIRTLSSFAQEKIIVIDGKKIKTVDYEKLHNISEMG